MTARADLENKQFGRLIALEYVGERRWRCKCECGGVAIAVSRNLLNGNTKSCGCLQREKASKTHRTHGKTNTSEYNIWQTMKARCYVKLNANYANYGGRGIKVCDRWLESFENFLTDMGEKPEGLSIDRVDVDGDYEPRNCRWASVGEQATNRRNNRYVEYEGRKMTISEWARELGVKPGLIKNRLDSKWSVERAFTTPTRKQYD